MKRNNAGTTQGGGAAQPRTPKRVAAYCRVSTETEMQAGSFEMQVRHFREMVAARPDMELAGVYGDRGKTGRSVAARPDFRRMLEDCEAGKIDLIVTRSISRFARNMGECVAVLRRLKALGIAVLFEEEGVNSMEVQGELILSILAAIAQEESNSISRNQLWANERYNAGGKPRFKPSYGYTKARHDWVWRIDEAQAARVRLAFQLAAEGERYCEIRSVLNEMERAEDTGLVWTQRRLNYLLTNANYTGDCLTNKNVSVHGTHRVKANEGERAQYYIEGHHEPLVSQEMFDWVQQRIRSGKLHSKRTRSSEPREGRGR